MAEASNSPGPGWRIPKACQECRKRKIRCNGLNPCKTCERRETPCIYRDFIRHRRKKHEYEETRREGLTRRTSPDPTRPSRQRSSSVMNNFPNSVSATHMASPSCPMQLYYGPTSHFSLMQHIYRDLVSSPMAHTGMSSGVEEAGAGLELFSFRRIFFGTPDPQDAGKSALSDPSAMFLPYDTAKLFLSRFLSTLYHMMPFFPQAYLESCLEQLYHPTPGSYLDVLTQATILLAMATASLGTEFFTWGDILYERVKSMLTSYDDVVNIQTVQNEQGRPNSAFLHLGTASRKALAAGLHKDVPYGGEDQTPEKVEARRVTFWSLYVFETWFCFHTGRPSSLSLKDVAIEYTQDPFIRVFVHLCQSISRSADEIYGQHHESLLHMWRVARSINNDLRDHEKFSRQSLGFGDADVHTGPLGVRQTIFTTLYYHTQLLTFRPFLIFRGHLQRERKMAARQGSDSTSRRPTEIPPWLNEACNYVLNAARKTIHHLSEASRINDLVRQLRYHGYFIGSSAFTLIYELVHDTDSAPSHLPWVYASLQTMSTMRQGDPIASSISAIQTTLRKINPSYEWSSPQNRDGDPLSAGERPYLGQPHAILNSLQAPGGSSLPNDSVRNIPSDSSTSQWQFPPIEGPETGRSGASNEDLLDFTQTDMGWDFDFSTMDLESFFSVYQSADPLFPQGSGFA